MFQDLEELQSELIKLKLWTEEKCKERSLEKSMETIVEGSMERSRSSMESSMGRSMEGLPEEMAEWDIVTEFIGPELAEFFSECEVRTELQGLQ